LHWAQVDQMKQIRQIFLFLLVMVVFSDCKKRPTFPASPEISFLELKKMKVLGSSGYKDSVIISLYFKDGDGDLGNTTSENYFTDVYAKLNGEYKQVVVTDTTTPITYLKKNGRFPSLNPDGRQGPLEGSLNYGVSLDLRFYIKDSSSYTLKFNIYIKDNAGHSSNTIETPEITVNNY